MESLAVLFPCGHPRSEWNSKARGDRPTGVKCRICANERARVSIAKKRLRERDLAVDTQSIAS